MILPTFYFPSLTFPSMSVMFPCFQSAFIFQPLATKKKKKHDRARIYRWLLALIMNQNIRTKKSLLSSRANYSITRYWESSQAVSAVIDYAKCPPRGALTRTEYGVRNHLPHMAAGEGRGCVGASMKTESRVLQITQIKASVA